MALHLWSIGESQGSKPAASQSDAIGYAAGLLTWLLASGVLIAAASPLALWRRRRNLC